MTKRKDKSSPELGPEEDSILDGLTLNTPSTMPEDSEAAWVRLQGSTPLEFLADGYKNPWWEVRDRINAAKAILEYCHKKLPQRLEIQGDIIDSRKVTADSLSKLNDEELKLFTTLLGKMESPSTKG